MKRLDTETRQILIKQAVQDIISAEGMSKLSIKNIALKVGVSEGAIYRHFKSKKEILLSIINDVYDNLVIKQQEVANSDLESSKKLFTFFSKQINYLIHNKGITILLFSEATHANDSNLKEKLLKVLQSQKKMLKQIVEEGVSHGLWSKQIDIDDFTTFYMGIPAILNIEIVLSKENFNYDEFCNRMFVLLKRILNP
ncbi:MAG: TetR/AcrR family transcriptional regulator [Flavobacteriaceae bacterium]|nr:TetR/AcrR family transcriptional regulator [Flavobacteriaceae bacterium]